MPSNDKGSALGNDLLDEDDFTLEVLVVMSLLMEKPWMKILILVF